MASNKLYVLSPKEAWTVQFGRINGFAPENVRNISNSQGFKGLRNVTVWVLNSPVKHEGWQFKSAVGALHLKAKEYGLTVKEAMPNQIIPELVELSGVPCGGVVEGRAPTTPLEEMAQALAKATDKPVSVSTSVKIPAGSIAWGGITSTKIGTGSISLPGGPVNDTQEIEEALRRG
jgi:hypothetical protein